MKIFSKDDFNHLQTLLLSQTTLLGLLIEEMNEKKLIDGDHIMSKYEAGLNEMVKELLKK